MEKYILCYFANKNCKINRKHIENAVKFAKCNLQMKYSIDISLINVSENDFLIKMTTNSADNVTIGRHLKGISAFLIKNYDYGKYRVGKRLLTCKEINYNQYGNYSSDSYDLIVDVINLIKTNDPKIEEIKRILYD